MAVITHITPVVRSEGGMQGLIRRHAVLDRAAGYESRVVSLFEKMPADGGIGLGGAWWWTPAGIRRAYRHRGATATQGALALYHNAWGLPLLAPGDRAERRLAYLHTDWPALDLALVASARWCDGFLCVSADLASRVRRIVPDFPSECIHRVEYPVNPPSGAERQQREPGPLRIGYVGRLERRQKRVERLPELLRAWTAAGSPAAEWHVLGDGPERARLEAATAGTGSLRFHGWLSGADYWRALANLDFAVFFSDYEGTPIALLEAMSVGVTPLFPAIGGDGEELSRHLAPACVYPAGDMALATRQLADLAAEHDARRRLRARELVVGRTAEKYAAEYVRAVQGVLARPRRSATDSNRAARLTDHLPMAVVSRYHEAAIWS